MRFASVGRSSGRAPVGRAKPGDVLTWPGSICGLRADTTNPDNFKVAIVVSATSNLGGDV